MMFIPPFSVFIMRTNSPSFDTNGVVNEVSVSQVTPRCTVWGWHEELKQDLVGHREERYGLIYILIGSLAATLNTVHK